MFSSWTKSGRRRQFLETEFPHAWKNFLEQRVRHWKFMDPAQRRRLEGFIQGVVAEKDWAGGSGFELTDEMKVAIAGHAGIMTLGLAEPYYFDRLKSIIIYPGAYVPERSEFEQYAQYDPLLPNLG